MFTTECLQDYKLCGSVFPGGGELPVFSKVGGMIAYLLVLGGDIWEYSCFSHRRVNNPSCHDSRQTPPMWGDWFLQILSSYVPLWGESACCGSLFHPRPRCHFFLTEHLIYLRFAAYRLGGHLLSVVGFPSCFLSLCGFALVLHLFSAISMGSQHILEKYLCVQSPMCDQKSKVTIDQCKEQPSTKMWL